MTFTSRILTLVQPLFSDSLSKLRRRRVAPAFACDQVEQRTLLSGTPFPWSETEVLIGAADQTGNNRSADDVIGNVFDQNQVFFTQTGNTSQQAIIRVTLTRDVNGQITGATTDYTALSTLEHNSVGLKSLDQFNADTLFYTLEEGGADDDGLVGRVTSLASEPLAHVTATDLTNVRTGGVADFDPEGIAIDRTNNFLYVMTDDGPNTDVAQFSIDPNTLALTFNWVTTVETGGTNGRDGIILPDGRVAVVSGTTSVNIFAVSQDGATVTNLLGGATSGTGRDTPQDLLVFDGHLYLAWESGIIDAFELSNLSTTPVASKNLDTIVSPLHIGGLGLTNDGHLLVSTRSVSGSSSGQVYAFNLPVPPVNVINVTTFADVVNAGDGLTSLREAIIEANTTADDDQIVLLAGTYSVTLTGRNENATLTGDLDVFNNGTLSIVGQGSGQTIINATGLNDRVFHVLTGAEFTLESLTVTGGKTIATTENGAGLYNQGGTVTILNSAITANTSRIRGGGLAGLGGTFTITNSTISDNYAVGLGGGLFNEGGSVTVTDSTFNNNFSKTSGGGLASLGGTVDIAGSTFSNNVANTGGGGGLYNSNSTANIVNSTFSGNRGVARGGGIWNQNAQMNVNHSTITRNRTGSTSYGGGIFGTPNLTFINHTIVAGNIRGTSTANDVHVGGAFGAGSSFNLIGTAATPGGLTNGVNGNIVGVNGAGVRPIGTILNTTLADNGGTTLTHLLVTGSVAIDAGNPAFVTPPDFDQRKQPRVNGTAIDIGAVEFA